MGARRPWEVERIGLVPGSLCVSPLQSTEPDGKPDRVPAPRTDDPAVGCGRAISDRPAKWHDIRGLPSRDIIASCFEFALSDTIAENLQMSGGETMTVRRFRAQGGHRIPSLSVVVPSPAHVVVQLARSAEPAKNRPSVVQENFKL